MTSSPRQARAGGRISQPIAPLSHGERAFRAASCARGSIAGRPRHAEGEGTIMGRVSNRVRETGKSRRAIL